jgi:hypothetical protein
VPRQTGLRTQRADDLRAQIDAERGRADRAEAAITGERARADALRDRIDATAAQLAAAEGTASDVEATEMNSTAQASPRRRPGSHSGRRDAAAGRRRPEGDGTGGAVQGSAARRLAAMAAASLSRLASSRCR